MTGPALLSWTGRRQAGIAPGRGIAVHGECPFNSISIIVPIPTGWQAPAAAAAVEHRNRRWLKPIRAERQRLAFRAALPPRHAGIPVDWIAAGPGGEPMELSGKDNG